MEDSSLIDYQIVNLGSSGENHHLQKEIGELNPMELMSGLGKMA